MYCKKCGKPLSPDGKFCQYCGTANEINTPIKWAEETDSYNPYKKTEQPQLSRPTDTNYDDSNPCAIAGFIFSFFIAIVGLILSIVGCLKERNHGLAAAGVIISVISMVTTLIMRIKYY